MKRWRLTWLGIFLGLLAFWLGNLPALAQGPSAPGPEDFCGPSQSTLICPRTTLTGCLCSLTARSFAPASDAMVAPSLLVEPKLPRYKPALRRLLPEPDSNCQFDEFHPSVPTQPPKRA